MNYDNAIQVAIGRTTQDEERRGKALDVFACAMENGAAVPDAMHCALQEAAADGGAYELGRWVFIDALSKKTSILDGFKQKLGQHTAGPVLH